MIASQVSADAGRVLSWASLAWPEKGIACPTCQVVVPEGASMTGVGAVLPTVMTWLASPLAPWGSVTRSRAV